MSKRSIGWKKSLLLLAMGGSTMVFGVDGFVFGSGCVRNANIEDFWQAFGNAAIQRVSDSAFRDGKDYEVVIRPQATDFAQSMWDNWVDLQIPNDP